MKASHVKFASSNVYISDIPPNCPGSAASNVSTHTRQQRVHQAFPTSHPPSSHPHNAMKPLVQPGRSSSSLPVKCRSPSLVDSTTPSPISPDLRLQDIQIFSRIRFRSRDILRYSLSLNPETAVLFHPEDLSQPATKPKKQSIILFFPPLEMWEVVAANSLFVTVRDVVLNIYGNRSRFPLRGVFNGLAFKDDPEGDVFIVSTTV